MMEFPAFTEQSPRGTYPGQLKK